MPAALLSWSDGYMSSERSAPRRRDGQHRGSLLTPEEIERLFARLAAVNPAPRTELAYADPFTLLVAVVLSAQATDVGVNKATKALFAAAPTPAAMVALGEERIREHIKTIGLFRNKAKNVLALSQALLERHGGRGAARPRGARGPARASAARPPTSCSTRPSASRRSRSTPTSSGSPTAPASPRAGRPRRSRPALDRVVPAAFKHGAHHWLILHGRYVCIARRPACPSCVVRDICRFPGQDAAGAGRRQRRKAAVPAQSGS